MFITVRNHLAPNFTTEDFRILFRSHPAKYVYRYNMTPVTRGAHGYVSYKKGIIQQHLVHRYATRKAPSLCSRVVFWAVLSLVVSTQTVFVCYMSVNILWGFISDHSGVCACYALVVISTDEINMFFKPSSVICMRAQVNSNTSGNNYGLIQTFKYQYWGFQVYFKSILVYDLKIKSDQNVHIT